MLPRYVRHDLWRQCEPQHTRAEEAATQSILAAIDFGYEVVRKPPKDPVSFAHLYRGPGEPD